MRRVLGVRGVSDWSVLVQRRWSDILGPDWPALPGGGFRCVWWQRGCTVERAADFAPPLCCCMHLLRIHVITALHAAARTSS